MCLSVPGRVDSIKGREASVSVGGTILNVSLDLVPGVKVGDYVLVHAGYALQKIDEEEAKKTLEIIKQIEND
jgi:hydrogenase expression/formation protein HypC